MESLIVELWNSLRVELQSSLFPELLVLLCTKAVGLSSAGICFAGLPRLSCYIDIVLDVMHDDHLVEKCLNMPHTQ